MRVIYIILTKVSCHSMLSVAQNALRLLHPEVQQVCLLEHKPRFDEKDVDPTGLKHKLAKFANHTYEQMLQTSPFSGKIVIGKHRLDCAGNKMSEVYGDSWTGSYDGVHMNGRHGKTAYTRSVLQILKDVLPSQSKNIPSSSYHFSCPQTQYNSNKQKAAYQHNQKMYTVPVQNQFDILGN